MSRPIKLLILIIMSLSVYFIYQNTKESNIQILSLGDNLSKGINSYTIVDYSHLNYYEDYLKSKNKKVKVISDYSREDLTIHELLELIKTNNTLKRDLMESHKLFITIGYNDLLYKMSLEEDISIPKLNNIVDEINTEYKELLEEIKKYYKNEIIIVGYPKSNKDDYYINLGIRKLNRILNNNTFINTYNLLNNRNKYFFIFFSYYPNRLGYERIYEEIKKLDKN